MVYQSVAGTDPVAATVCVCEKVTDIIRFFF